MKTHPVQTLLLLGILAAGFVTGQPVHSDKAQEKAQEKAQRYNVWLDGRAIGTNSYFFEQHKDKLQVKSEANFKVKVAFVTLFSYQHKATEIWSGNCLTGLLSKTITDGKSEQVAIDIPVADCAGTYTYWDKERLRRPMLTNAQTGKAESAEWKDLGAAQLPKIGKRKTVKSPPDSISAVELKTPSAQFTLYYDKDDELVMMQTDTDGRTITYLHDSLTI